MLSTLLKILSRFKTRHKLGVVGVIVVVGVYLKRKRLMRRALPPTTPPQDQTREKGPRDKGPAIDGLFFKRLARVWRRAMPRLWCRETYTALLLAAVLFGRTWLTLAISSNMGDCVRDLCDRNWLHLRWTLFRFLTLTTPAAITNAALKYLLVLLAAHIRERLTVTVHEMYMRNMNYYKANKVGERALENADQLVADDVKAFADQVSEVYSDVLKPVVDFVLFSIKLKNMLGGTGPLGMYAWFAFASVVSAVVLPSFGRLAAVEQRLEGVFRAKHAQLIGNSEMVAFMGGEIPEVRLLNTAFNAIIRHKKNTAAMLLTANTVTGFINKYAASMVGWLLVVLPVYRGINGLDKADPAEVAQFYVVNRQIMEGLADAVLRLFTVQKQVSRLSGLTARVHALVDALDNPEVLRLPSDSNNPPRFVDADVLRFERVSVFKPDGTILAKELSFEVPPNRRIIITGENGCGKSSLFRVLRGLWPLASGTIYRPADPEAFYFLSQVIFVPEGSLREILIYPQSVSTFRAKGRSDADLLQALEWAHLSDLRCNDVKPTLDTVLEWGTALSPGQKQRMAFARLLYHRPKYAVLDECTNGVAPDVEVDLYNRCRKLGITVFSISHKLELKALHDYELHYFHDGQGGYSFTQLEPREDLQ